MTLKLITGPSTEPISLDEVKTELRIDGTELDASLTRKIKEVRQAVEHELGRALISQTWEQVLDSFPTAEVGLGMPPVANVLSVKYLDVTGVEQTVDDTLYAVDLDSAPGWVLPAYGHCWPQTMCTANAVRVRFLAGYGGASAVPEAIKGYMFNLLRADHCGVDVPPYALRLVDRYRTY